MRGRQRQVTELTFDLDLGRILGRLDLSGVWTTSRVGFGDYAVDSVSVQPLGFNPTGLDFGPRGIAFDGTSVDSLHSVH